MKRLILLIALAVAVLLSGQSTFAQQDELAKLDMYAIKSIRVEKKDHVMATVTVVFKNQSGHKLRLRNGDLKVIIDEKKQDQKKKTSLILGDAKIEDFTIDSAKDPENPCVKELDVNVDMGPTNDEKTFQRLIDLVNLMCDPSREITLTLKGKTTVGVAHPRGWVDKHSYSFDLKWTPTIQREILLK